MMGGLPKPPDPQASQENTLKPAAALVGRGDTATGRLTLGLYNCYDPKQWHDIMRITLARAAPVALAFDCDLATFGFPFDQVRPRGSTKTVPLLTTADVAKFVSAG